MAIDISHRRSNHINKITISKKSKKGLSFLVLSAVAFVLVAAGALSDYYSISSLRNIIFSTIGFGAIPIIAFLVSEAYRNIQNFRKTAIILGVVALVSHIPYVLLDIDKLGIFRRTSLAFPMFMGFMVLGLQDRHGISRTVKSVLTLLICLICTIADNGSIMIVWTLVFGSNYDNSTKKKLFYTFGIISLVINIIYGIKSNCWYHGLTQLGFLLSVPFIRFYNPRKANLSKGFIFLILYPLLFLALWLIKNFNGG